jgi:putative addiction module component (TIGR02574 family)
MLPLSHITPYLEVATRIQDTDHAARTLGTAGEALALTNEQRAQLARTLIDSLEADDSVSANAGEIEGAWHAEVERRDSELESDPTLAIPAEQVFAEAERRLQDIRKARELRRRQA